MPDKSQEFIPAPARVKPVRLFSFPVPLQAGAVALISPDLAASPGARHIRVRASARIANRPPWHF